MNEHIITDSHLSSALRKTIRFWWLIPLVAFAASTAFCASQLLFGVTNQIASIDFGEGYNIKIWEEMDGIADPGWDPDHANPDIYYEITKAGHVVVPKRFLTVNVDKASFNIKIAFAEDHNLVCIYDSEQWDDGVIVKFDLPEDETWPTPNEGQQQDYLNQLRQENPDVLSYCKRND